MEFSFPMVQKYEWICMVGFGNSLEQSLHISTNKMDIWPWGSMLWWQTQPYKLLNSLERSLHVGTNKMDIWPWSSSASLYGWVWQWSHSLEWSTAHHYDRGRDLDKQGDHTTTLRHQYNGYMTLGQFALMANPTIQHAVQF